MEDFNYLFDPSGGPEENKVILPQEMPSDSAEQVPAEEPLPVEETLPVQEESVEAAAEESSPAVPAQTDSIRDDDMDHPEVPVKEEASVCSCTAAEDIKAIRNDIEALSAEYKSTVDSLKSAVVTLKSSVALNNENSDRNYRELEKARKGEYYCTIKPFLNILIELHLEINKSYNQYKNDKEGTINELGENAYNAIISEYDLLTRMIESRLSIQGVEIVSYYETGSDYIPKEHEVSSKPTESGDPALKGKLSEVLTPCYKYGDNVVRKAKIRLYK